MISTNFMHQSNESFNQQIKQLHISECPKTYCIHKCLITYQDGSQKYASLQARKIDSLIRIIDKEKISYAFDLAHFNHLEEDAKRIIDDYFQNLKNDKI